MFSSSLVFTTLVAALFAVSGVHAQTKLSVKTPENPVQCKDTKIEWDGGVGPYNVYVFDDCKKDNDSPIATFLEVEGKSVTLKNAPLYSGDGFFVQVEDSKGDDAFSDDAYVGGDADKADECKKELAAEKSSSISVSSTAAAATVAAIAAVTQAPAASDAGPTTMTQSKASTIVPNGVNNAANDNGVKAAGSTPVANGASSLMVRPVELALGVLAAGVVAFL